MRFGDAIKNYRLKNKLTLRAAALFCGITVVRLSELERQISETLPSRYEVSLLSKAYGIDFRQYRYTPDFERIDFEEDVVLAFRNNSLNKIYKKYGIKILPH